MPVAGRLLLRPALLAGEGGQSGLSLMNSTASTGRKATGAPARNMLSRDCRGHQQSENHRQAHQPGDRRRVTGRDLGV